MHVWTIPEWCALRKISRATFYNLIKAGKAPRTMKVGTSVRISEEADRDWVRACEADAATLQQREAA